MSEYIGYKTPMFGQKLANGEDAMVTVLTDEEVIRCRDCKGSQDGPWHRCETFVAHGEDTNGFCAWAERRKSD